MNIYMVDIDLPEYLDEEFLELLPFQKIHISELMSRGIITTYSMSNDKSKVWTTVHANSEREVGEIVAAFPLSSYFILSIHQLEDHDSLNLSAAPPISLN